MKINIFLNIKSGPYGGGNQFLKALRDYFIEKNVYSKSVENADVILFNSHHEVEGLIKIKQKYPDKVFIHRIDGPVFHIRKDNVYLDKLIYNLNEKIADASIFQSHWSRGKNLELGLKSGKFETTIINAPNPNIFNKKSKIEFNENKKIKIIATSWASSLSKGFDTYRFLDKNLDFSKFEMTFCGNSPYKFNNLKMLAPLPSNELAKQLKQHDIYITASKNDPCSNSLIEALHCELPSIGLNDGGHPEIIGKGGLTFNKDDEILNCLENIKNNYAKFQENINLPKLEEVGKQYLAFIKNVFENTINTKKINIFSIINIYKSIYYQKILKFVKK